MRSITTHTGILTNVQRYDTSHNGNPRFVAEVDGYTFYTGVDSAYGYSITNYRDKLVTVTIGMHRGKVTLHNIRKAD